MLGVAAPLTVCHQRLRHFYTIYFGAYAPKSQVMVNTTQNATVPDRGLV